jgi:hypothetical protein
MVASTDLYTALHSSRIYCDDNLHDKVPNSYTQSDDILYRWLKNVFPGIEFISTISLLISMFEWPSKLL